MKKQPKKPKPIVIGSTVRHHLTGHIGTVIGIAEWLQGPTRVSFQPTVPSHLDGRITLVDGKMDNVEVCNLDMLVHYQQPKEA